MSGAVLVVNAGSSSVKYKVFGAGDGAGGDDEVVAAAGVVERIGEAESSVRHTVGQAATERQVVVPDHAAAVQLIFDLLGELGTDLRGRSALAAVGHRVVMGGRADRPAIITDEVVTEIEEVAPLAPLHNPPNLAAIAAARRLFPDVPHVAVFDTAFFHDLPAAASTYAIDRDLAERHGIRRYGFHGISHEYVSGVAATLASDDRRAGLRQVVLHLGNGASASAVAGGRPVDTSMGLTPLEGLVMGTRPGDLDAGILLHLGRQGLTFDELDDLLNHRSGLHGLAGENDMRDLHRMVDEGDERARLALDVYVARLKTYIGAYAATMGGLDQLVFTAGVGENDPIVRAASTDGLGHLGIEVDPARNAARSSTPRAISPDGSATQVLVVPTDEELSIARQVRALTRERRRP